jgi:hypothetical protein
MDQKARREALNVIAEHLEAVARDFDGRIGPYGLHVRPGEAEDLIHNLEMHARMLRVLE